jgi:intracellular multiplication protein IcmP
MADQADYGSGIALLSVIFCIAAIFGFTFLSEHYAWVWFYLKWPLIKLFYYVPDTIRPYMFFWIEQIPYFKIASINEYIVYLNSLIDTQGGVKGFVELKNEQGIDLNKPSTILTYMYLPYIALPLLYFIKRTITVKTFNKSMSMAEFRIQESETWPVIKPAIHLSNKVVNDINKGPWAMALRPEVFFDKEKYFDFYDDEAKPLKKGKIKTDKFSLNYEKAYNYFIDQLGDPWTDIDGLAEEELHMLAVLLPKINRDGKKTEEMLALFGNYYSSETGFKARKKKKALVPKIKKEINEIIEKYYKTEKVQAVIKRHHYKQTVFSGLLNEARNDGVLSNGQFIWLKPLNRPLWFNMCSIGRKLPFPDCAGIWSHYLTEKSIDAAITLPRVVNAVAGLDDYFILRYTNYISYKDFIKKED